jgi:hypothetical protein
LPEYDVIVVGNTARAAAVSARAQGPGRVAGLEKAEELRGGKTHCSGGLLRFAYARVEIHTNYPGGTGLMSGAVVGRLAGANAAGE